MEGFPICDVNQSQVCQVRSTHFEAIQSSSSPISLSSTSSSSAPWWSLKTGDNIGLKMVLVVLDCAWRWAVNYIIFLTDFKTYELQRIKDWLVDRLALVPGLHEVWSLCWQICAHWTMHIAMLYLLTCRYTDKSTLHISIPHLPII